MLTLDCRKLFCRERETSAIALRAGALDRRPPPRPGKRRPQGRRFFCARRRGTDMYPYRVFLSYSSIERDTAEKIVAVLLEMGLRVLWDYALTPGQPF